MWFHAMGQRLRAARPAVFGLFCALRLAAAGSSAGADASSPDPDYAYHIVQSFASDDDGRAAAVVELAAHPPQDLERVEQLLIRTTRDPHWRVRVEAIEALARAAPRDPTIQAVIAAAADDPTSRVRTIAGVLVERLGIEPATADQRVWRRARIDAERLVLGLPTIDDDLQESAALAAWIANTSDSDYGTRVEAVQALGTLKTRANIDRAIPALIRATEDQSWFVRLQAVRALEAIAPHDVRVRKALAARTDDSVTRVRQAAAEVLGPYGDALLAQRARDAGAPAIARTARPPSAPVDPVTERLAHLLDPPLNPGEEAVDPLGALGADRWRALPVLVAAFHNKDDHRGDRAAELLAQFGRDVVPIFSGTLSEPDVNRIVRRRAFQGLIALGDAAYPAIEAIYMRSVVMRSDDDNLPLALRVIAQGAPRAQWLPNTPEHDLLPLTDSTDPAVAAGALRTLAVLDPYGAEARRLEMTALSIPTHPLHATAVDVASAFGPDDRIGALLLPLLDDPDPGIRMRAVRGLISSADSPQVTAALVNAVRRKNYVVRSMLAEALRAHPKQIIAAEVALKRLASDDPDEAVRIQARNALIELDGVAAAPDRRPATRPASDTGDAAPLPEKDGAALAAGTPPEPADQARRSIPQLLEALRAERGEDRATAVGELAGVTASAEIELVWKDLVLTLFDDDPRVRQRAVEALSAMEPYAVGSRRDDIRTALVGALGDSNDLVISAAVKALASTSLRQQFEVAEVIRARRANGAVAAEARLSFDSRSALQDDERRIVQGGPVNVPVEVPGPAPVRTTYSQRFAPAIWFGDALLGIGVQVAYPDEHVTSADARRAAHLLTGFYAGSDDARMKAAREIVEIIPVRWLFPYVEQAFRAKDPDAEEAMLRTAARTGGWGVPFIVERMERPADRMVNLLSRLGPSVAPHLAAALKDQDPDRRRAAFDVLDHFEPQAVGRAVALDGASFAAALSQAISTEDSEDIRRRAIAVLGALGPTRVALLTPLLSDEQPGVRADAFRQLRDADPQHKETLPALLTLLESGRPEVRVDVARFLAELGPTAAEPAVPMLKRMSGNRYATVRQAAVRALLKLDPTDASLTPALLAAVTSGDRDAAALIVPVMSRPARPEIVHRLTDLTDDTDAKVRDEARRVLTDLGAAPATQP